MHRARVSAVNGNRVQAEGKWLNIIGNRTVSNGDYIWTDGRCVYGNFQEGGSPAPIIDCGEPYVPIFMKDGKHYLYHKGKLKEGQQGVKHQLMINMENTFAFSDKSKVLDVSLSQSGELQELIVERYAFSHGSLGYSYHYYDDGRGAKSGVYFDGEKRDYYWQAGRMVSSDRIKYADVLREGVNVVGAQSLDELKRQTPSNAPESMTVLPMAECRIIGGWYESEEEYCLFLKGNARSLYMSGRNLSLSNDSERCWEADYGTLYSLDVEYC